MWLIQYAIFGLVAGALARLLHPGRDPMNWVWTMILGIGGAVVGGFIGSEVFGLNTNRGLASWATAIGGAILLLVVYYMVTARRAVGQGSTTTQDYKKAVFDDLSRGPKG